MFCEKFTIIRHQTECSFPVKKCSCGAEILDSLLMGTRRAWAGPQFRKLETAASRLSPCDHLGPKPLLPVSWIISESPLIRPESTSAKITFYKPISGYQSEHFRVERWPVVCEGEVQLASSAGCQIEAANERRSACLVSRCSFNPPAPHFTEAMDGLLRTSHPPPRARKVRTAARAASARVLSTSSKQE